MIHVEDLALVETERFANIMKCVCVNCFLERLPQEILPGFGIGDVLENGEHDIVANQALRRAEKTEVTHDDEAIVGA